MTEGVGATTLLRSAERVFLGGRLTNPLLNFRDVISFATRFPGFSGAIVNGIGSARVAVARFAHRTGVGDQPRYQMDEFPYF